MTNRPNGTLYVGVTSDLARRVWPMASRRNTVSNVWSTWNPTRISASHSSVRRTSNTGRAHGRSA
ncbi:MAG: hypothetical protein RIE87_12120 [Rhodospirillales bacterium]